MRKLISILILSIITLACSFGLVACECKHQFTNYVSNNDATCLADGTKTAVCDNGCGEKDTVTDVDSKLGHKFTNYVSNNDATCEVDGTKTAVCDNGCGTKDTVIDVDSKLGHTNVEINVDPTCEDDGVSLVKCENCEEVFYQKTIEKLNHDYVLQGFVTENTEVYCAGVYQCLNCEESKIDSVTYETLGMPILCFDGDITNMSKDNEVLLSVKYQNGEQSIDCDANVKWQGSSSIYYPKKNFTMKLLNKGTTKKNKVEMKEGWGEQSKYCLKANYIDFSHARNVVSGKLYSQIVKSRDFDDKIENLANGGAVDGFPIFIFINGSYQGLYTLNIPKDKWMFGMQDDEADDEVITKQALLMGDAWTNATALKETVKPDYASSGFELEYCSTEDTIGDDWVLDSFNSMIEFVLNNDGEDFKNGISQYVSVERTIDSMIFTWLINAGDNRSKNILWTTYDGTHWFSSMYDMDGTWGVLWDGTKNTPETQNFWWEGAGTNMLWQKIWANYKKEITARYFQLRATVLSDQNILNEFDEFFNQIPDFIIKSEKDKWSGIKSINCSSFEDISIFLKSSTAILDKYFLDRITE